MNTFTIQELYELSDGLSERRLRLLKMRDNPARIGSTGSTLDRLIAAAESAHTKVMTEIVNRTSVLQ